MKVISKSKFGPSGWANNPSGGKNLKAKSPSVEKVRLSKQRNYERWELGARSP
jgi:hypothetical protein